MKKTKIVRILSVLLILSANLFAQNTECRFKLKEGDWFEMQLHFSFDFNGTYEAFNVFNKKAATKEKENTNGLLNLRYQLQKQLPNGNQVYRVNTERIMVKMLWSSFNTWLGYDTYYPPYSEGELSSPKKFLFEMEVNPKGNILRFVPDKANPTNTTLYLDEISPKLKNPFGITFTFDILSPELLEILSGLFTYFPSKEKGKILKNIEIYAKQIIETKEYNIAKVVFNDSITGEIYYSKTNGVLSAIMSDEASDLFGVLLTDASFPIPANTMINGMLKDQPNQEVLIRFVDSHPFSESKEFHFKTDAAGAFNCPFLLTAAQHMKLKIGNKSLDTFMEPGDTLNIKGIGRTQERVDVVEGKFWDIPEDASNTNRPDFFSGPAANNTLLSIEMNQWLVYYPIFNSIQAAESFQVRMRKKIDEILTKYSGKASPTCISYFKTEAMYYLATDKFYFFDNEKYSVSDNKNFFNGSSNAKSFFDYPSDFFSESDTMAILLNPYQHGKNFNEFLYYSQRIKQDRLGLSVGRVHNDNFLESYYFALASLKGYPLYSQLAKLIDKELRKEFADNSIVIPYYQAFLNNCTDPGLTGPLRETYEAAGKLKIGNKFPLSGLVLQDSSIFNPEQFKGKPVCLVVIDGPKSHIGHYKEEFTKFKPDEVQFIIARITGTWMESKLDSAVLKMPNVTYIEVNKENIKSNLLLDRNKIFMLDKWFRIVENNAEDPSTHKYTGSISKFEKSLRKTIETKRFSKAEKTAMIKTTGWSFGTILFTFLIGLWIYKIWIRRIKQQEAAKRRIKELEIKAIRSQMNPHFIFNALNSIQSLINGNQFKEANIYLSKFAVLLRGVLNNSEKSRISLSDELQAVELYCQLEQLRFEFKFEISINPEVNGDLIEIPGMIIQPLAENAVVHGLSGKGDQGKLNIQVKRQNGNLCVRVSDNGVGLQSQKIDELSQKGFGLKLVEERINILNLDGKEARLTVENRSNTAGTVATLIIPID
ncbi:MAG: histidine kinase [Prolixibacteraceae bacterium]|jgi:hypothetical protein